MRMTSLSLKGRGRWVQVLNDHVVRVVPILQLLLVAPLVKVTVPAPSKLMNRMTTTMTMKTSLWTLSWTLCLGHLVPLVRQLKWGS
jgi:hypothetical protein